ncbi:ABC transporter permease [Oerskovia jenensis]|uniref:ABC-2 type transport system permease protein n=1 Tax=Oerskovia jenensis TaxID=162169 RepID=A0ABS2LIV4_9CELL|nr:ABC transporter permease [Oerskovia jenensis]MBM7480197.1 ABC-2 type transport system permease protein [Oerskovia jenensis]
MSALRQPTTTAHSPVSTWGAVSLVAGREISTRIRSKAFVWTTVALLVGVVLGGFLLSLVGDQGPAVQKVGVTSGAEALGPQLTAAGEAVGAEIQVSEVSEPEGRTQLADGDLDALVTGTPESFTVVVQEELGTTLTPVFTGLAQQAALAGAISDLGGDPSAVAQEIASAAPTVETLEPTEARDPAQIVTGMVGGILIFIALMTCGQLVAQGVVEEKTSRVVELLLATIRPWQLMAGKVLGIGAIGLIQLVVVVGGGVGTAFALGLVDASSVNLGATAAWVLVWFVIGFVMYSLALAALAALVSRQEDVGSVITPVLMLMMIPYIIGISIGPWDPENPLVVWLSYIPFCSPLLMPIRIALGTVETWEILVAVGLSLALVPVLVWLAGKIYSNAVLRTGGRVRLKDALRAS